MRMTPGRNTLFYGDNLDILRQQVADESVDLVYLDPPFNSNANYNVLFKSPDGKQSQSQIEAFDDTWHWSDKAEEAYDDVIRSGHSDAAEMLYAMRKVLKENDMMAYLAMMSVRLVELHRVLKATGSLYLHCDPTASHYLKILLDAVFGVANYRNEIIWKRQSAHSDAKRKFSDVSDVILFYSKSKAAAFQPIYRDHDPQYIENFYRFDDKDGRGRYRLGDMSSPNPRPNLTYEWRGYIPPAKGWRYQLDTMQRLHDEGRIWYPSGKDGSEDKTKRPALKRYLGEQQGSIVTNVWDDIAPLHGSAAERLGYPTQKPVALLERIVKASSNEGDVVLDPFCGCGTTIHAAEKLNRQWVGIDITHIAVGLIRNRLRDAFPAVQFDTLGVPNDLAAARELADNDKHEFQLWALSMVGAQPFKGGRKGADGGVDGYIWFQPDGRGHEKAVVSIKGGNNVDVGMIRDLIATVQREKAKVGVFITLVPYTKPMRSEAAAAGFYESPMHGRFPKIQILTIEDLFEEKRPQLPWISPSSKQARREVSATTQMGLDL